MGGKGLSIFAGILTVAATYVLSWGQIAGKDVNGLGAIVNITGLFSSLDVMGIIILIVTILVLISGILQLISKRVTVIIGSIFPLLIGIIYLLAIPMLFFRIPMIDMIIDLSVFNDAMVLVKGIIPFYYVVPGIEMALGALVLLLGGILGLIGGIKGRD